MQQPGWAVNADKFNRALAWVTEQVNLGALKEVTEEAVKERYVTIAGLVNEEKVRDAAPSTEGTLESLTVPQLKARAADQGIDISACTNKADLITTIREVEEAE